MNMFWAILILQFILLGVIYPIDRYLAKPDEHFVKNYWRSIIMAICLIIDMGIIGFVNGVTQTGS